MKTFKTLLVLVTLLAAFTGSLQAQNTKKNKHYRNDRIYNMTLKPIQFYSDNEMGFMAGIGRYRGFDNSLIREKNTTYFFETTNGIRYKDFAVGIGTGLNIWKGDPLYPLVLSGKYYLPILGSRPYVEANMGYLHGLRRRTEEKITEKGKLTSSVGIGIFLTQGYKTNVFIKAMYTYRLLEAEHRVNNSYDQVESYHTNYSFFRLSLGIKFGG